MVQGDYSRHIREALLVVEKLPEVNPPSGRVPGQVSRVVPILASRPRLNRGRYRENGSVPRVFGMGCKYRPKGATRGWPLPPRRPASAARRGVAPSGRLGGAWLPSGPTLVFP